jgi:glycerol-3-phosphate acyltransferase PlsY
MRRLLALPFAFASGCVPSARLVSWLLGGIRIEQVGTGNPGAANVRRQLGTKAGAVVLAADAAKAAVPVLWARRAGSGEHTAGALGLLPAVAHVTVVGGKGAATTLGSAMATDPLALAVVSPFLVASLVVRRFHAPLVFIAYLAYPLARLLLGRSRRQFGWSAALIAVILSARLHGDGDWAALRDPKVVWERLVYDRDPGAPELDDPPDHAAASGGGVCVSR